MALGDFEDISISTKRFAEYTRREKVELQDLNIRLGQYIARVRLLEEQNRKFVGRLQELSVSWGQKNRDNRARISLEISASRKSIAQVNRVRFDRDTRAKRIRFRINEFRKRIEDVNRLREADRFGLQDYEKAIREQYAVLAREQERYQRALQEETAIYNANQALHVSIDKVYDEIDTIVIDKLDLQSQVSRIELEIALLKKIHDTEVVELSKMVFLAPADTKEFFKTEIALAIRDIRKEFENIHKITISKTRAMHEKKIYDGRIGTNHGYRKSEIIETCRAKSSQILEKQRNIEAMNADLEGQYRSLCLQKEEEHKKFDDLLNHKDIAYNSLRGEFNKLLTEYESLLHTTNLKNSEIAIYRALVEGEEKRVGVKHDYQQHVEVVQTRAPATIVYEQDINGSGSNDIKFKTHATGNIVLQCDPIGRSITLENKSDLTENVSGWRITRRVDNNPEINYTIPHGVSVPGKTRVKIFPGGKVRDPSAIVNHEITSWGMGAHVLTRLTNQYGTPRAEHEQNAAVEDI